MSRLSPEATELLARLQRAEAPDPDFEARVGRGLHRRLLASSAGAVGVAAALTALPKATLAAGSQAGVIGAATAGAGASSIGGTSSMAGVGATSWVAGGLTAKLLVLAGVSVAGAGFVVAFRTPATLPAPHAIVAPAVAIPLDNAQASKPGAAVANQPTTALAQQDAPRTTPNPLPAPVVSQNQPAPPQTQGASPPQRLEAQQLERQAFERQRLEQQPHAAQFALPETASAQPARPSSVDFAEARAPSMLDEVNDLKRADELLERGRLAEAKQVLRSSEARHSSTSSAEGLSVERHALDLIARCRGATGAELQAARAQARAFAHEHAKSPLLGRVQQECGS